VRVPSAVVVPVSANALTVVSVPVPESIPTSDAVDFVVSPLLGGAVVGQLSGSVGVGSRRARSCSRCARRGA
jgi:hypothetical protein